MNDMDKYRGCLVGGAVGDALGYPIEFLDASSIFSQFGKKGITEYALQNGIAQISDDTQMTLFTATGLLLGTTRAMTRGIMGSYPSYIHCCYKDWYKTQTRFYPLTEKFNNSWLVNISEMFSRRAPGNTCLSALEGSAYGTIDKPINQSKGCGGVMRVAPIGLYFNESKKYSTDNIDMIGAQAAALTHGHSLGYIPAAGLVHIINLISHSDEISIFEAVEDMKTAVSHQFADDEHIDEFLNIIDKAVKLSTNENISDLDAIEEIGQGWVAEETLAIAIYCSLKYHDNFDKAIRASVNHGGDSDSTGAVTGNIVGAYLGMKGIDKKYLDNLELKDVIIEVADDLFNDCKIAEYSDYHDEIWEKKYIYKTYNPKSGNSSSTEIITLPAFDKLKEKVERLRTELSMLFLERDELYLVICPNIETAYMLELGALEYKAYKAQCEFLRIKRKYELIQAKINRQENVVISKIEDTLEQEFKEYKEKLDEQINKMNEAIERSKCDVLTKEENSEIKKVYRQIVKSLHPDLNPNITKEEKQLFENAVEAYKNGDIKTIRIIGEMVSEPKMPKQPSLDAMTELKENERRLENLIASIKKNIADIKSSYPYTMKEIVEDKQKTEKRKNEIANILNQYDSGISFYQSKIDEVLK
ncbi:MAG: ADP-ribosylglycohydrolase family protein [Clostridiales bacterium]|nr:ADP-ribosylglycohydrolase family protein [Clostridiales bacterium]